MSVSAGGGDDTITIGAVLVDSGTTIAGDVIDGGAGTDTLVATDAVLAAQGDVTTLSNLEVIQVSDALAGSLDVTNFQSGLSTVNLAAGADAADTGDVIFGAGASTLNIAASNAGTLTLADTGTATNDSVTINNTATAAVDMADGENLTVTGLETVTIVTTNTGATEEQNFGAISITADTGGTATLNLSGTNAVDAAAITAQVVDASGHCSGIRNNYF